DHPSLSERARSNLLEFVERGQGLALIHFANGAFRDWPDYKKLARRVWVDNVSAHDAFAPFQVHIAKKDHPITEGLSDFDTVDELYFKQQGTEPIEPLVTAHSKITGQDEPLAFAYDVGQGRVFQTLLGHAAESVQKAGDLIRRGAVWAA